MNKKVLTLALAGALSVSLLAGCSSPTTGGDATPPVTTPPVETATPTPAPTDDLPAIEPTPDVVEPTEAPDVDGPASTPGVDGPASTPTPAPSQKPAPSPEQPPQPEPTPAPGESAKPEGSAVQSVWDAVSDQDRPSLMDLDDALLTDLYGIDTADLVEYIGKMPLMSAHVTEFLIAQAQPGKADAIKTACETRLENLKGGGLYPSNEELVNSYKIVVNGDYVLFCIDEYADDMVKAFNDYTK